MVASRSDPSWAMVHDRALASVMCSKGKHGNLILRRYKELGQRCPVAVVVGMHPALFMVAGLEIPYGKNEYDAAGGLLGEPVEVIAGPRTEEQWDDYVATLDYRFTAEDEALVDRLVASGHPSTPGFNDPGYPIEGRRARTGG